jgi:integrase
MATIRKRTNGLLELRFIDADNERRSIYLPKGTTKLVADTTCTKVDHIVTRQKLGTEPDRPVAEWLAALPDGFYSKLVKAGLAPPRTQPEAEPAEPAKTCPTLKEWTDAYIGKHSAKPGTMDQIKVAATHLLQFFGNERCIDTITAGDAEDYRKWLQKHGNQRQNHSDGLAEATLRRYIGRSKQFFRSAVKHQLIDRNPFADEASTVNANTERMVLVPAEWVERCIRVAPCEDWRIILAFARYAGMRSHECLIQRWEDVDIANNRMTIRSNKTPPVRTCPIFPELRPHLLRAREMAPAGAEFVQTRYRSNDNIRTTFDKIVTKAGLVPWQKPLQNMRATRETELMAHYPVKDVTSWLGNSPAVALKHYAMVMPASFEKAVKAGANLPGLTAKVGTEKVPQNIPQTPSETARQGRTSEPRKIRKAPVGSGLGRNLLRTRAFQYPLKDTNNPQKQADFYGLENRTPQYTPQQLLDVLKQHLDPQQLAELVALLQLHLDQPQT